MIDLTIGRRAGGTALLLALAGAPRFAAAAPEASPATWRTWLPNDGRFRVPPPPDAAATRAELAEARAAAAGRNAEALARIAWWGGVPPAYRWNQIALEHALRAGMGVNLAARHLALLHTALADATVVAWQGKQAFRRPRPSTLDHRVPVAVPVPDSPGYPDEHAVSAATAAALLATMFPDRAAHFAQLAEEAGRMRVLAGVAFPSDVAAGAALGRQVAAAFLEHGRSDGSDRPWTGQVPSGPGLWNGTNPVMPQAATWRPWLLARPDEFRPAPPPAADSAERATELAALRAIERTPLRNARALFWEAAVGGLRIYEYWNNHASRLLMERGMAQDAAGAARVYALLNVAIHDAGVACWDAKYAFWTIRPSQLDRTFTTVFAPPNHPSYPAAHASFSGTAARVLAQLFPSEAPALMALAREAGESRLWAGIHYPSDVAAGAELARQVAARAIARARTDGGEPGGA